MKPKAVIVFALLGAAACSGSDDGTSRASAGSGALAGGAGTARGGAGAPAGGRGGSNQAAGNAGAGGSSVAPRAGTSGGGGAGDSTAGAGGAGAAGGGGSDAGAAGGGEQPPSAPSSFEETRRAIEDYAAAHPGMEGDILAKTELQLASDPEARALRELCGEGALPVIPQLVWEYGGGDHAWIDPAASALVYCVYIPTPQPSEHWSYDAGMDHVTADVFVLFPEDNPCADESGADQVAMCIGDPSNFEILVDTAGLNDGHDVGLELSEASTDLNLILPDGTTVHLFFGA